MNCPAHLIIICASLLLATSISLLVATSIYSLLLSPFSLSSPSRSRFWTPYSNLCYFDVCPGTCCFTGADNTETDQRANVRREPGHARRLLFAYFIKFFCLCFFFNGGQNECVRGGRERDMRKPQHWWGGQISLHYIETESESKRIGLDSYWHRQHAQSEKATETA
jgi:hypothetical protein